MSHKSKKAAPEATSEESVTTKSAESQEQPTTTPDSSTAMRKNKQVVWHYTYNHIVDILESGVLLPPRMTPHFNERDSSILEFGESIKKDEGFQADSKLLLFSQREDWEPASYRAARLGGRIVPVHRLEDYELYGWRVYRVGVSRDLLHPWMRLKRLCGMPPAMARALEQIARDLGSNPYDWWGTLKPIPDTKWKAIEIYDPETKTWQELERNWESAQVVYGMDGKVLKGEEHLRRILRTGVGEDLRVAHLQRFAEREALDAR